MTNLIKKVLFLKEIDKGSYLKLSSFKLQIIVVCWAFTRVLLHMVLNIILGVNRTFLPYIDFNNSVNEKYIFVLLIYEALIFSVIVNSIPILFQKIANYFLVSDLKLSALFTIVSISLIPQIIAEIVNSLDFVFGKFLLNFILFLWSLFILIINIKHLTGFKVAVIILLLIISLLGSLLLTLGIFSLLANLFNL